MMMRKKFIDKACIGFFTLPIFLFKEKLLEGRPIFNSFLIDKIELIKF